jgi:hypothetical protein
MSHVHEVLDDLKDVPVSYLRKYLRQESRKYPAHLVMVPRETWPPHLRGSKVRECWRSNYYLLQVYDEGNGIERLSVCKNVLRDDGQYDDKIPWEVLQRLKSECGRGDKCAVECYPPDAEIVNVANMRHLFVLPECPDFVWRKK